jgi:long-chain acyl-CoA synthetase
LLRVLVYYLLVWPSTLVLGCPRVIGRDLLKSLGEPVLVICNHVSMIDPGLLLWALPPRFRHKLAIAMEGERLFAMRRPGRDQGLLRRCLERIKYSLVVTVFNVFPLPQKSGFRDSFAYAGQSVDRGFSILVFPEGVTTQDGKMAAFRGGIGMLAANLGIPVVPVRIDGLFELKAARRRVSAPRAITVTIGEPVRFNSNQDPAAITAELESRVAGLALKP